MKHKLTVIFHMFPQYFLFTVKLSWSHDKANFSINTLPVCSVNSETGAYAGVLLTD